MIRALVALVLCACGATPPHATALPHEPAVDTLAQAAVPKGAGVAVVVMRGDRVVHAAGYGDLTPQSVVPLASLSKHVWAAGIAQLVDEHRLDVTTRVSAIFPEFPAGSVTVEQLLQQTSGLGVDRDGEDDEQFTDIVQPPFTPGTWWHYSNRGAILARRVLDRVSGMPFARYLHDRIAAPLGLASFVVCPTTGALYHGAPLSPATMERVQFVCGNALDVARFERGLEHLLSPQTLARMRTPARTDAGEVGYGWFTRIDDLDGHRGVGHSGNFEEGVSVMSLRFPGDDLTIAVLMNGAPAPGQTAWALATHIARAELGLPAPVVRDHVVAPELLAAIVGTYDLTGTTGTITAHDGHAHLAVGGWEGDLVYVGGTRFVGDPVGIDADRGIEFIVDHGVTLGARVGDRFVLDGVARRLDVAPKVAP